jgi:hypothetical protein
MRIAIYLILGVVVTLSLLFVVCTSNYQCSNKDVVFIIIVSIIAVVLAFFVDMKLKLPLE